MKRKVAVVVMLSMVFVSMRSAVSLAFWYTEPASAVIIVEKPLPGGGKETTTTVEPSESGAWKGALTGGAVGTYIGGPVGAVIGGSIGAAIGWIFGPAD